MYITLTVNAIEHEITCPAAETLLAALRSLGYHGAKFGDEHGLSGADTVLLDGKPVNANSMLAAQAAGHKIGTIEALSLPPSVSPPISELRNGGTKGAGKGRAREGLGEVCWRTPCSLAKQRFHSFSLSYPGSSSCLPSAC